MLRLSVSKQKPEHQMLRFLTCRPPRAKVNPHLPHVRTYTYLNNQLSKQSIINQLVKIEKIQKNSKTRRASPDEAVIGT